MSETPHSLLPPLQDTKPETVDQFLSEGAKRIAVATGADECSIFLADGQDRIVLRASTNPTFKKVEYRIHYRTGEGLTGWVAKNQRPLRVQSTGTMQSKANSIVAKYPGLRWRQTPGHTESHQVRALVAAPIKTSREQPQLIMGVVRVVRFVSDTAFAEKDAFTIEQVADELGRVLPDAGIVPLQPSESNEVYRSPLVRVELVKKINADVMAYLSNHPDEIHNLHHRVFEELVAELLIRDGWKVDLTLATCDGGYDVLAVRSVSGVGIQLLVQAKKYRPDRPVGVSAIREALRSQTTQSRHKSHVSHNFIRFPSSEDRVPRCHSVGAGI